MSFYQFESEAFSQEKLDLHYMNKALELAQIAFDEGEIPIGAIIVCQNKIIGKGYNLTERLIDVTAHAEMQAFTAAANALGGKYLKNCTLYVTVEPCIMCAGASYWTQIDRIVFGAADLKKGYSSITSNILHPKTKLTKGILEAPCAQLMTSFFEMKRKKSKLLKFDI